MQNVMWGTSESDTTDVISIGPRVWSSSTFPVASLNGVLQHGYFGHGGRGRLAGGDAIAYRISLAFPYGPGGGSASFRFDDSEYSVYERASVAAGGIDLGSLF